MSRNQVQAEDGVNRRQLLRVAGIMCIGPASPVGIMALPTAEAKETVERNLV